MSLLIDFLYPIRCVGCHQAGEYLCSSCLNNLKTLPAVYQPNSPLDGFVPIFRYRLGIRRLIKKLKYQFLFDTAPSLARLIHHQLITNFPHLVSYWQTNNFVLTSIPLHWRRQNWRGFNQSALIAQLLAKLLNLPYQEFLVRSRFTATQVSQKDKQKRISNISNNFLISPEISSPLPPIIIFDDVITTGATVRESARILRSSGSESIWGLSIAG